MYGALKMAAGEQDGAPPLSMLTKCACAAGAGAIGAFAGNPGDVAMVRMQADGNLAPAERRGYRNIVHAVRVISQSEGLLSMWRSGLLPNMNRAMIVTVGQLAAYDQCKEILRHNAGMPDTIPTHFAASFMAAFIASALSNPVDVAKTRLMTQKSQVYTGMANCLATVVRDEGPGALYKGFGATFARQCPYVVVTWLTVEQLKKALAQY